ncbi:MAG: ABC transporter substrate-binding protein [Devosia sp.]|nr:ABC transporter substrate-binding protein [Devosia sp.]
MRRLGLSVFCSVAAMSLAAPALADPIKLEVANSWTSGGEAAAKQVLVDALAAKGVAWEDSSIAGFESASAAFNSRLMAGNPPPVKSAVAGLDQGEVIGQGLMTDIDATAKAAGVAAALPKLILDNITFDGKIYEAPIGFHGESMYFYSMPVFAKAGITAPPKTWDEMFADLDKVKAAGLVPVAWSGQDWQVLKVFDAVLLSVIGTDGFNKIFTDKDEATVRSPGFAKAVDIFNKFHDYIGQGAENRNWNDATAMVITGKAALQFEGDWAKGEFVNAKQTPGKDYGCEFAPGSDGTIIISDVFVFPKVKDADQQKAQQVFAETVFDPQVQVGWSVKKGSFPVRTDVDTSSLDICAQKDVAMAKAGKVAPEQAIVLTPAQNGVLTDLVSQYFTSPTSTAAFVDKFVAMLKNA